MGSESLQHQLYFDSPYDNIAGAYLQKFKLYETRSNFYIIGWDKSKTLWKVLKIERSDPSELNIFEDSMPYSKSECSDLLGRINGGNKSTGGLKFVTTCYGIVGFIKFLGPHYMLLVTKRRKIGTICGHAVYAVSKTEMFPIPNSSMQSHMDYSKNENRYKKLLRVLDLTKGFFFSYSYHVMLSLQKNFSTDEKRPPIYKTLFVWNEYLTRGIHDQLKNTLWTVALVYGFFKQVKLSVSGRDFILTLIARRSRHYAGTRYLKRGVNIKGRVANDVETEQIVSEDVPEGCPVRISSAVQIRGSIPLFWSQETSRLNIKPDIILSKKDHNFGATKLHFENLAKRYGNPIIILNLIKAREKKPRESILLAEFAYAIEFINKDLNGENCLKFLHWDLNKHSRNKAKNVLDSLTKVAANALDMTGFFYCHVIPCLRTEEWLNLSYSGNNHDSDSAKKDDPDKDSGNIQNGANNYGGQLDSTSYSKPLMFQKGLLRTNCIDCLDRTNVAQYCYGLVVLGRQLHALGFKDAPDVDLDSPLADDLMKIYEAMGDTLAFQYSGSAAHNKIFSERRGQPKAVTQSQEFFRTLQRYYSNAYMDAEKQDAINLFLGHFRPQQGKPALWELDSDQHYDLRKHGLDYVDETHRSTVRRSMSDGNMLSECSSPTGGASTEQNEFSYQPVSDNVKPDNKSFSDTSPETPTHESVKSYSRYTPSMSHTQLFTGHTDSDNTYFHKQGSAFSCSNFLDVDWLSSSGNSCEEETYESCTEVDGCRSALKGSSSAGQSSNSASNGILMEIGCSACKSALSTGRKQTSGDFNSSDACNLNVFAEFSESFVQWIMYGSLLFSPEIQPKPLMGPTSTSANLINPSEGC